MQQYREELQSIGVVFQKKDMDYAELSAAISNYKQMVYALTNVDVDADSSRLDIFCSNGKAIGLTWAALCLDDIIRTKTFVSGVFKAVQKLHREGKKQVHILYAGTGPFATLVLPVLASYSPAEVQVTLVEINKESFDVMQGLLRHLGFDDHVKAYENVDATTCKVEHPESIDIIVSETLQCGLVREQQIPITINLLQQVGAEVILIPESLALDVCWLHHKAFKERDLATDEKEYCTPLFRLLEINKKAHEKLDFDFSNSDPQILVTKEIVLHPEVIKTDKRLALLTRITVFEEEKIYLNESGLTLPIFLRTPKVQDIPKNLRITYEMGENPGYRVYFL